MRVKDSMELDLKEAGWKKNDSCWISMSGLVHQQLVEAWIKMRTASLADAPMDVTQQVLKQAMQYGSRMQEERRIEEKCKNFLRNKTRTRIELSIDGDHWCALFGLNLQDGVSAHAPIVKHAEWNDQGRFHALDKLRTEYPWLVDVTYVNLEGD